MKEQSNYTVVVEVIRGRISVTIFCMMIPSGRCVLSICSSNIKIKLFQDMLEQTFLHHVEKSSLSIMHDVNSKKFRSIILLF